MSKVIFKLSYKSPNLKTTSAKNIAHINYIATRPGVDKTVSDEEISSSDTYINYINERKGSHGLFDENGIADIRGIKEELKDTKSFVWRAVVSLHEEDAINLKYDKNKWKLMLNKQMLDVAEKMNISIDNFRWCAALHEKKGHPHAHIVFWEKEKTVLSGKINENILKGIRKGFTDEIFEDERLEMLTQKNTYRDLLHDNIINDLSAIVRKNKNVTMLEKIEPTATIKGVVAPKLYEDDERVLTEKLKNLAELLPKNGRIAYKLMPANIKKEIDIITKYILEKPDYNGNLIKFLKATQNLTKAYTTNEKAIKISADNAYKDINKRLGQIILKASAEIERRNKLIDKTVKDNVIKCVKRTECTCTEERVFAVSKLLISMGVSKEETASFINDWNNKNVDPIELRNEIIDKAEKLVFDKYTTWGNEAYIPKKEWNKLFEELGVKPPEWIYAQEKIDNVKTVSSFDFAKDLWKSVWSVFEQQRKLTEREAHFLGKRLAKQQGIESVTAKKELKNKKQGLDFSLE